jgi:GT2 family glycosyltransferase
MIDISIIIVNYNVKEYIIDCIQSIIRWTPETIQYEIIVVDNNSQDGSVNALETKFPEITILKNKNNIGFTRAINQGANIANGAYLFLLNPDTLFLEDSMTALYSFLEHNHHVGIVGPKLISTDGNIQQSYWKYPTLISTILSIYHLDFLNKNKNSNHYDKSNYFSVDAISGGSFFLAKNLFNDLNGFNDNLFWMEDIDFCKRASTLGHKIAYLPKTKLVHFIGKSSEKNWVVTISNRLLSKIKYFKLHHGSFEVMTLITAIYLLVLVKCTYFLFLSPFNSVYHKKFMGYLTTLKLLLQKQYQIGS